MRKKSLYRPVMFAHERPLNSRIAETRKKANGKTNISCMKIGTDTYFPPPLFSPCGIGAMLIYGISEFFREDSMRESLTVSGRGQITLPANMRKRLGIEAGGVLIAEEREGDIVLRPAAVLEIETYSDADIARWDAEDRLDDAERTAILQRFNK
jgi:antitoxin PrlF